MISKITVVLSLFVMTGCGLGQSLKMAGNAKEQYKTCIVDQAPLYSARYSDSHVTAENVTKFTVAECMPHEETYVVTMTTLAMTITADTVSPEKFLADEEATLRSDLHELAASLVKKSL